MKVSIQSYKNFCMFGLQYDNIGRKIRDYPPSLTIYLFNICVIMIFDEK